jgi:hypothetical protein
MTLAPTNCPEQETRDLLEQAFWSDVRRKISDRGWTHQTESAAARIVLRAMTGVAHEQEKELNDRPRP